MPKAVETFNSYATEEGSSITQAEAYRREQTSAGWSGYTAELHDCRYCGQSHTGMCQKIQRIEYYPDGTVKAVEFHKFDVGSYNPQIWVADAPDTPK